MPFWNVFFLDLRSFFCFHGADRNQWPPTLSVVADFPSRKQRQRVRIWIIKKYPIDLVVIGSSTGGIGAIQEVLTHAGRLPCPIIIAQHMPFDYVYCLAEFFSQNEGLTVVVGFHGMTVRAGQVVLIPGDTNGSLTWTEREIGGRITLNCYKMPESCQCHPSVDLLFQSASHVSTNAVGVILSGRGNDGTAGAQHMARRNGLIVTQCSETSEIDEMPVSVSAAIQGVDRLSPREIGLYLRKLALPEG